MDAQGLEDLFAPFAKVAVRKLFGGLGAYHEGLIFAVVLRSETYLRTDAQTEPQFAAAGSEKWSYQGKNNEAKTAMPYWRLPEAAHDDEAELIRFCKLAVEAARRAAAGKAKAASAKSAKAKPARKSAKAPAKVAAVAAAKARRGT